MSTSAPVLGRRSGPVAGVGGRVGKSGKSGISHGKDEGRVVHAGVNCVCIVCGSAHLCGCVVNGTFARAAFWYYYYCLFCSKGSCTISSGRGLCDFHGP